MYVDISESTRTQCLLSVRTDWLRKVAIQHCSVLYFFTQDCFWYQLVQVTASVGLISYPLDTKKQRMYIQVRACVHVCVFLWGQIPVIVQVLSSII